MLEETLCSLENKINVNEQNIKLEDYYASVKEKWEHVYIRLKPKVPELDYALDGWKRERKIYQLIFR